MEFIEKSRFCEKLFDIYDFGYKKVFQDNYEMAFKQFKKELTRRVLNRIEEFFKCSSYFVFEKSYVETEWKEMIAYHYTHTSYSEEIRDRVIRIHFLDSNKFSAENYLGYITLRPIPELRISLSYIYLNWNNLKLVSKVFEDAHIMSYSKKIHIEDKELTIKTYPFFAQDSIVTCCGDANVIMLSTYMSNQLGYKKIKISDIRKSVFGKYFLPRTVSIRAVKDILTSNGIPFKLRQYYVRSKSDTNPDWQHMRNSINAYVESNLPVIFGASEHMIQIIGYVGDRDGEGKYLIYDDSGHFYGKLGLTNNGDVNKEDEKKKYFCYMTNFEKIKHHIVEHCKERDFFFGICEHERVYMEVDSYLVNLAQYIHELTSNDVFSQLKNVIEVCEENDEFGEKQVYKIKSDIKIRTFLVDSNIVKQHISNSVDEELKILIKEKFIAADRTVHYVWYSEIYYEGLIYCIVADPTRFQKTYNNFKMFFEMIPIPMEENKKLVILN